MKNTLVTDSIKTASIKDEKIALLFPGQGAQHKGMCQTYLEKEPLAQKVFAEASQIVGRDLVKLVLYSNEEELTLTINSQIALFVTAHAQLQVAKDKGLPINAVAGFSLGEYNALVAAGYLCFEEALLLVQERARLMHEECVAKEGAMAAILNLEEDKIHSIIKALSQEGIICIANYNCPGQRVISGQKKLVEKAVQLALQSGAKALMLKVAGAFHSPMMAEAEKALTPLLDKASWQKGLCPIALNSTAKLSTDVETIQKALRRQITSSVLWEDSIKALEASDITCYIEVGAGSTLKALNKRIGIHAKTTSLEAKIYAE